MTGRSPAAARQLASRARRRIRASAPSPDADLAVQHRVVDAFLAATRAGDFEGLIRVLDPDVVFRFDGGGAGPLARPPVVGADAVAGELLAAGAPFAALAERVSVNGGPGALVRAGGRPRYIVGFTVTVGRIAAIDLIGDPAKMGAVIAPGALA